jgi:hypothetical protein
MQTLNYLKEKEKKKNKSRSFFLFAAKKSIAMQA